MGKLFEKHAGAIIGATISVVIALLVNGIAVTYHRGQNDAMLKTIQEDLKKLVIGVDRVPEIEANARLMKQTIDTMNAEIARIETGSIARHALQERDIDALQLRVTSTESANNDINKKLAAALVILERVDNKLNNP